VVVAALSVGAAFAAVTVGVAVTAPAAGAVGAGSVSAARDGHSESAAPRVARLDVTGALEMAGFDAVVLYDTAVLSPTRVALGPFAPDGSVILGPEYRLRDAFDGDENGRQDDGSAMGEVVFGSYSAWGRVVSGDGMVATVTFVAVGRGDAGLALDEQFTTGFGVDGTRQDALFVIGLAPAPIYLPLAARPESR